MSVLKCYNINSALNRGKNGSPVFLMSDLLLTGKFRIVMRLKIGNKRRNKYRKII